MSIWELFILAVGLSMDAFAMAICKGLALRRADLRSMVIVGLWFGGFQVLMPLVGYFTASLFSSYVEAAGHFISFALLLVIGVGMIRESFSGEEKTDPGLGFLTMLLFSLADSIDALAAGVSFAFIEVNLTQALLIIGVTTFLLSALGVKIGALFGSKYRRGATLAGGIILILLGVRVLIEGLG